MFRINRNSDCQLNGKNLSQKNAILSESVGFFVTEDDFTTNKNSEDNPF